MSTPSYCLQFSACFLPVPFPLLARSAYVTKFRLCNFPINAGHQKCSSRKNSQQHIRYCIISGFGLHDSNQCWYTGENHRADICNCKIGRKAGIPVKRSHNNGSQAGTSSIPSPNNHAVSKNRELITSTIAAISNIPRYVRDRALPMLS